MPDLATGWKPKNIQIPSPIIIKCKSYLINQLIHYYKNDSKMVYLGIILLTQARDTPTPLNSTNKFSISIISSMESHQKIYPFSCGKNWSRMKRAIQKQGPSKA